MCTVNIAVRINGDSDKVMKRMGLQPLSTGIPEQYASDPGYCPRLLEDSCIGANDSDQYAKYCDSKSCNYVNCELFKIETNHPVEAGRVKIAQKPTRKMSDPLEDTVIMHRNDIKELRDPHKYDASVHDRVADGENPEKFQWFARSLGVEEIRE